jgi:lipopolysaccharide/colanic/teichoic acid biosynthesis glycosyltransferase
VSPRTRYLACRRGLELVAVALAAPLVLPVSGIVALAIWIEGRGPVLVRQVRPGRDGVPFTLLKFRTMRVETADAPFRLTEPGDPRVTRVGRFLRRSRLDELPQLLNVLAGSMSLIGPRPVPFQLYDEYRRAIPNYDWRHAVRPGLFGHAQVELGYTRDLAGERAKWELDVEYVRRVSPGMDARIVLAALRRLASGAAAARAPRARGDRGV